MTTKELQKIRLIEYQSEYSLLTKEIYESTPNGYEYLLLIAKTKELETGYKVTKVNKPTKKGTKITCKEFNSLEEVDGYSLQIAEDFKKCLSSLKQEDVDILIKLLDKGETIND